MDATRLLLSCCLGSDCLFPLQTLLAAKVESGAS
jgi:hypothetical protein